MEAEMDLKGRNLLKELDFTKDEWLYLIDFAAKLRQDKREGKEVRKLEHKNIALIFEKASTRTRCAFEVASYDQGAHVTYLGPEGSQIGYKETMKDTARVLGRMYDGIEYRGFAQTTVETLGEFAGVPVWNGLTDEWHPTQMLADMLTMRDHKGTALDEVSYCYIGDARNNTANSLLVSGALVGMDVRICGPKALWPSDEVQSAAKRLAATSGARVTVTETPEEGVKGVDFVYTDVWLSMGEPPEEWDERIDELIPYQVNAALMRASGNKDVKFMHCLPALHNRDTKIGNQLYERRGLEALEVTEEVFESPASVVFDEAENRLHTIKAVMVATLG
jgi:ornithine carbamoyltransferase